MKLAAAASLLLLLGAWRSWGQAAAPEAPYSRVYAFSAMAEYSNDSSHIVLGRAEQQKIAALGFQYERRVLRSRWLDLSYSAEVRPAMLVSGPAVTETYFASGRLLYVAGPYGVGKCVPAVISQGPEEVVNTCGREVTYAEGLAPFGFRVNFAPRHRLQAVFSNYEGYMFSTRPIPTSLAGAFNYTFEFGLGFEWWLSHRRSVRLEYALQHFSNKDSADENPGVDSGLVKLTYSFGK